VRDWALDRLDGLVWKPVDGSGGYGLVIGPHAEQEQLDALAVAVEADPRGWIAQMPIALSTAPTYVDGSMGPRHLDLRPFALHDGEKVWVVPGGLTRVALPEGSLIVNSSQGGGSKDTWVLAGLVDDTPAVDEQTAEERGAPEGMAPPNLTRQPPDPGPPVGQTAAAQQQQQQ
jgi:uncharacterized circularly permuted ATP-grasp superfamily protein